MSIQADVKELKSLRLETKALSKRLTVMRKRMKDLEGNITAYLRAKDQQGVKFEGENIIIEEKEKYGRKKPKESQQAVLELLKGYGVPNPEKAVEELSNARKGPKVVVQTLRTIKNKVK